MVDRLRAGKIGPVREAGIHFGDLTIFVAPQATGKNIFLQLLKLLVDKASIHETMRYFGMGKTADAREPLKKSCVLGWSQFAIGFEPWKGWRGALRN